MVELLSAIRKYTHKHLNLCIYLCIYVFIYLFLLNQVKILLRLGTSFQGRSGQDRGIIVFDKTNKKDKVVH